MVHAFSAPLGLYAHLQPAKAPPVPRNTSTPSGNPESACSGERKNYSRRTAKSWCVHYRDSAIMRKIIWIDLAASSPSIRRFGQQQQSSTRSQSQPLASRGRGRHFLATVRSYASRAVFPVHSNCFPRVRDMYAYGLNRFGDLVNLRRPGGAGTWGPAMLAGDPQSRNLSRKSNSSETCSASATGSSKMETWARDSAGFQVQGFVQL